MTKLTLKEAKEMMDANGDNLDLRGTGVTALPDGLFVGGNLDLGYTGVTALPDGLFVGGNLDLGYTGITTLPDDLFVGESLYLQGTDIPVIFEDDRGYELRVVKFGTETWCVAGFHTFKSKESALAHWGGPNYPRQKRGKKFCDAIEKASAE